MVLNYHIEFYVGIRQLCTLAYWFKFQILVETMMARCTKFHQYPIPTVDQCFQFCAMDMLCQRAFIATRTRKRNSKCTRSKTNCNHRRFSLFGYSFVLVTKHESTNHGNIETILVLANCWVSGVQFCNLCLLVCFATIVSLAFLIITCLVFTWLK